MILRLKIFSLRLQAEYISFPTPLIKLLIITLLITPALLPAPCNDCCREALFKPKRCQVDIGPRLDRHATESWGPHGYNYDGIPFYLDDGYGHQGGGSWW